MVRKTASVLISILLLASIQVAQAADLSLEAIQDMRKNDPQAAQALANAVQRGDFAEAQRIFQSYQNGRKPDGQGGGQPGSGPAAGGGAPAGPSLFERTLSGQFPEDLRSELRQFGYDLFTRSSSPFAPPQQVPVGPDYLIGPGDQFTLTLWGTTEGIYNLQVSREGNVTLPKVGVVPVAGVRFGELERTLKRHLSRYFTNFNLSVAMGAIKTITVYAVGEVENPGSYSLSSLISAYGALFAAGGPTKRGTLRAVQVLRAGKVVKTIDLYEFLLKGDRSQDVKLQNEDTIFVPLIGPVAGVAGMVYRPAIYELKGTETLGGLVGKAGGLLPIGLGSRVQLTRFSDNSRQEVLDISLPAAASPAVHDAQELKVALRNMDVVTVFPIYDKVWDTVSISGDVRQPGMYQWRNGLRLSDVIRQAVFLPTADLKRAEIVRMSADFTDRTVIGVDLAGVASGDAARDPLLLPRDHVRIFTAFRPAEKVTVSGEVGNPGEYEITRGDRLSDLFRRVNGFTAAAYPYGMVFKRRDVKNAQGRNLQTFITRMQQQILQAASTDVATAISREETGLATSELTLNRTLLANLKTMQELFEGRVAVNITTDIASWAGTKDDLLLQDGDVIIIPKQPQEIMVMGEVHSPGAIIHAPELTVKEYLRETGGYTDYADKDQVYVLKANGFASSAQSGDVEGMKLKAGDTVFVPQDVERYAVMRNTKDIIDILFKTAIIVATVAFLL